MSSGRPAQRLFEPAGICRHIDFADPFAILATPVLRAFNKGLGLFAGIATQPWIIILVSEAQGSRRGLYGAIAPLDCTHERAAHVTEIWRLHGQAAFVQLVEAHGGGLGL